MEARLQQLNNAIPHRSVIQALADKFTSSPARSGKVAVQPKQVTIRVFLPPPPSSSPSLAGNSPPHLDPAALAGVELVPEPEVLAPLQELQGPPDADADQDAAHGVRRAQVASFQGYALCLCALRLALRSFVHVTLAIRSR